MESENQPTLFAPNKPPADFEKILLFALGNFQERGFQLIGRKLPLDRLLGAFKRAAEHFGRSEMSDDLIAETLGKLGAKIDRVPNYVAKHPFRITVSAELAERSLVFYKSEKVKEN